MNVSSLSPKAVVRRAQWSKIVYRVQTAGFACSNPLFFQFPFAQSNPAAQSQNSEAGRATLAPSPFQKMNVLSDASLGKSPFVSNKTSQNFGTPSTPPTEEFMANPADYAAELLAETKRKHPAVYEKVVVMKIPPTKELFEKLRVQEDPSEIYDTHKQIQEMVAEFSTAPASHPHSPKFSAADPTGPSYYKAEQSVVSQSLSQSFNNLNTRVNIKDTAARGSEKVESANFSPFARPNSNPQGVSSMRTQSQEDSLFVSPFQPPNTSIPEYYSEYLTDSQVQSVEKSKEKPADTQFGASISGASAVKAPESSAFSLFGGNMQTDSRQQVSFSTTASFIGASQSSGTSIRNLAATSLASTYSGSVESVSERGGVPGTSESAFVTNANIDFNPFTSGHVVKYKERITEVDDSALATKDNGQGFFCQRSLKPTENAQIDMKQLRLLGDAGEQNRVKELVMTEDEWADQSTPSRHRAMYAGERQTCCECGKTFEGFHALDRHMTASHPRRKVDLFQSLQRNLGSMRQLHHNEAKGSALQHTDVSDWYDYGREEQDALYTRPFPSRPCSLSPEKLAGYVARRQAHLAEVEKIGERPAELSDGRTEKEHVAVSSQLVNEIVLSGSLEYSGEKAANGSRYLQLYLQTKSMCESRDFERIPVRYFLWTSSTSVQYPTKQAKNNSAMLESAGISSNHQRQENPFAMRDVSSEDASLLFALEKAFTGCTAIQCLVIGELKKDGVWDCSSKSVLPYAYIRLNASKGRLMFTV